MDYAKRLAISYYKPISVINEAHHITLVRHELTEKICVKKVLQVYNTGIYEYLRENPVLGTPKIFELCEEDDHLIVIEEYIAGESLASLIEERKLTEETCIELAVRICGILDALHHAPVPVVHRDLKPSNIIITSFGNAVLLDFNAAKFCSAEQETDTRLLGTQGYAAPEQYGFGSSTPRTDIYALGVLLKEMLASLETPVNRYDSVIAVCTRMDPDERYGSAKEVREALSLLGPLYCGCDSRVPGGCDSRVSRGRPSVLSSVSDGSSPESSEVPTGNPTTPMRNNGRPARYDAGPAGRAEGSTESMGAAEESTVTTGKIRRYMPPGFRTGTPWKMLSASVMYALCAWICLTSEYNGVTGPVIWFERIGMLVVVLSLIFTACNYLNIRRIMPLCAQNNRFVRILGAALLSVIVPACLMVVMVLIESFVVK